MTWNAISNDDEAKCLLKFFGHFHDACIREAHMWTGHWVDGRLSMTVTGDLDTSIKFVVQRQFRDPSCIELLFEKVTRINIVPTSINYDSIIFESNLGVENEEIFWSVDTTKGLDNLLAEEDSWVQSRKLSWREVDGYLGKELHYGQNT